MQFDVASCKVLPQGGGDFLVVFGGFLGGFWVVFLRWFRRNEDAADCARRFYDAASKSWFLVRLICASPSSGDSFRPVFSFFMHFP